MENERRRSGALAAGLAVLALGLAAVPAYGALADGSSGSTAGTPSAPTTVQDSQAPDQRPDRSDEDCPFKDGQRGGGGSDSDPGSGTTPEPGGGSTPETAF